MITESQENERFKKDDFLEELRDTADCQFTQLCEDEDLRPNKNGYIRLPWLRFEGLMKLAYLEAYLDMLLK